MENYGEQRSHHHCPHLGSASVRTDVFRCLLSFHTLASTCSLRHAQTWRFRPTHLPMLPLSPIIYYIAYCCRCRCSRTTTLFTKSPNNVQSKYDISLKTSFPNNFSNLFSSSSCLSSFFWLSNLSWLYNFPFNRSIHLKQKILALWIFHCFQPLVPIYSSMYISNYTLFYFYSHKIIVILSLSSYFLNEVSVQFIFHFVPNIPSPPTPKIGPFHFMPICPMPKIPYPLLLRLLFAFYIVS